MMVLVEFLCLMAVKEAGSRVAGKFVVVLGHVLMRAELDHVGQFGFGQRHGQERGDSFDRSGQVFLQILVRDEQHVWIFALTQPTRDECCVAGFWPSCHNFFVFLRRHISVETEEAPKVLHERKFGVIRISDQNDEFRLINQIGRVFVSRVSFEDSRFDGLVDVSQEFRAFEHIQMRNHVVDFVEAFVALGSNLVEDLLHPGRATFRVAGDDYVVRVKESC